MSLSAIIGLLSRMTEYLEQATDTVTAAGRQGTVRAPARHPLNTNGRG
jgi:hypothetical protein